MGLVLVKWEEREKESKSVPSFSRVRPPQWWAVSPHHTWGLSPGECVHKGVHVYVCAHVCVHVPTSFGARGSCVVTLCKLVPGSKFVRQSRYGRLMGKLSGSRPGRKVSSLHRHGDPTSEPKPDKSHPVPGRAESVTTVALMDGSEKQPQRLRGLVTLNVGRGWEESKTQM